MRNKLTHKKLCWKKSKNNNEILLFLFIKKIINKNKNVNKIINLKKMFENSCK